MPESVVELNRSASAKALPSNAPGDKSAWDRVPRRVPQVMAIATVSRSVTMTDRHCRRRRPNGPGADRVDARIGPVSRSPARSMSPAARRSAVDAGERCGRATGVAIVATSDAVVARLRCTDRLHAPRRHARASRGCARATASRRSSAPRASTTRGKAQIARHRAARSRSSSRRT